MIRIAFLEPQTPKWRQWRERCNAARDALIASHENGSPIPITSLYKHRDMLEVYKTGDPPFYRKCAYCEVKVIGFQHGDIEHFRPKGAVTDHTGTTVSVTTPDGQVVPHPGYYWLAYDWTNLLLSCGTCNQGTAVGEGIRPIGKRTRFPVVGFRASQVGEESREQPMLINPVHEEPGDHLAVDERGVMASNTDRGQMCIDILAVRGQSPFPRGLWE